MQLGNANDVLGGKSRGAKKKRNKMDGALIRMGKPIRPQTRSGGGGLCEKLLGLKDK